MNGPLIRLTTLHRRSPRHSDDDRQRRLLWLGSLPAETPEPETRPVLGCYVPDPDPIYPEALQ